MIVRMSSDQARNSPGDWTLDWTCDRNDGLSRRNRRTLGSIATVRPRPAETVFAEIGHESPRLANANG
jgi:hypothetical protein